MLFLYYISFRGDTTYTNPETRRPILKSYTAIVDPRAVESLGLEMRAKQCKPPKAAKAEPSVPRAKPKAGAKVAPAKKAEEEEDHAPAAEPKAKPKAAPKVSTRVRGKASE